jgi:hypothetical protein
MNQTFAVTTEFSRTFDSCYPALTVCYPGLDEGRVIQPTLLQIFISSVDRKQFASPSASASVKDLGGTLSTNLSHTERILSIIRLLSINFPNSWWWVYILRFGSTLTTRW